MLEDIKTTREAAKILGYKQEHVAYLCRHGEFAGVEKKGKTWLIPYESLQIYIIQHGSKKRRGENISLDKEAEQPCLR